MLALIGATVLLGCGDDDDDELPEDTQVWSTQLAGQAQWQDVSGESEVRQVVGAEQFTATVSVQDDEAGSERPWHVHFGTCATGGGIVGDPGAYPVLNIDENGSASANATVQTPLEPGEPYHVNIHLSPDELETIIACGDLVLDTELDAGVDGDAAVEPDAAIEPDAGTQVDAAVVPDAGTQVDAAVAPDAGTQVDAAVPDGGV